jgi:hypothetical protein
MDLREIFSLAERVELELVFSYLCRRYVESEHCIADSDYKVLDKLFVSDDAF